MNILNQKNIFDFLKDKRGYEFPLEWRIVNDPDSFNGEPIIYEGYLNLSNMSLTKLPDNLTVKIVNTHYGGTGCLNLDDSLIEELPINLTVEGWISLEGTPLGSLYNSKQEFKRAIESSGGYINGNVFLQIKT